ncbi:MAG: hypothetical protein LQ350_006173 [Teloschistes chrysophthalmus]|nr:MAG: hypothetical protein LQ350_006173 [Niorma chrysophthalma]
MKISVFLAAVLSFQATFAFPQAALEAPHRRALVPRMNSGERGGGGSQHRASQGGKERNKVVPGYEEKGWKHPDAPGMSREKAREMEDNEPTYPAHKESVRVVRHGEKTDDRRTEVREVREKGKPVNYVIHYAEDSGSHLGHAQYRWDTFGEKADSARYVPDSNPDVAGKRNSKIGGVKKASERKGEGRPAKDVIDETEARGLRQINQKEVGDVPFTAFVAGQASSVHRDSPYQKMAMDLASKEKGGTVSYSHDKNAPRQAGYPARGPYTDSNKKWGEPMDEVIPKDHSVLRKSRHSPDNSGRRSRSPERNNKRSDDQDWDWRDFAIVETYSSNGQPADGSQPTKRDAVGQATHKQENAESDHPITNTPSDQTQEYHDYLSAYEAIRNNATELIMPFIVEMVNGSNSSFVWDAAWDIMSLADPAINVMGPLQGGMHCFDYIEEQMVARNTPEEQMDAIYVFHGLLIAMYQEQWNKAYNALDGAGMINDLVILTNALTTNETWAQSIKQDLAGTNDLNDYFLNGPYSEMPDIDQEEFDSMIAANGTGTADNSTSSSSSSHGSESMAGGNETATASAVGSATDLPIGDSVPLTAQTGTAMPTDTVAPRVMMQADSTTSGSAPTSTA